MLVGCLSGLILAGCAETTLIRSSPPGATVYVDGNLVGVSPVVYSAARSQFRNPHTCRVELEGYAPREEPLRTTFAVPGRALGAAFTLGILYVFKSPYAFRDTHDVVLTKLDSVAAKNSRGSTVNRLERLQTLRAQGTITEAEFQRYKAEIEKQVERELAQ